MVTALLKKPSLVKKESDKTGTKRALCVAFKKEKQYFIKLPLSENFTQACNGW